MVHNSPEKLDPPSPPFVPKPVSSTKRLLEDIVVGAFKVINGFVPWHKLPPYLGLANLLALRIELRRKNLYDTDAPSAPGSADPSSKCPFHSGAPTLPLYTRTPDGQKNDLEYPRMGCVSARFGRNVPRDCTKPSLDRPDDPNPREISNRLLARAKGAEIKASSVNLLAAAWIQFQVHDWFNHLQDRENPVNIKVPDPEVWGAENMTIPRTKADKPGAGDPPGIPAFRNENSHWWDASQIYGDSPEKTALLRGQNKDGTLDLDNLDPEHEDYFLPRDGNGLPQTGFANNWWLGLELLHTLFVREHNAICARLKLEHPHWSGDQIFETAQLINSALMAKIHTVEWTPAILAHPTIDLALNANWWGVLGEKLHKAFGRVNGSDVLSGIPGSATDHHAAPYSLTEEFVAVYRLHPLIPDEVLFYRIDDGTKAGPLPMEKLAFEHARKPFMKEGDGLGLRFSDVLYSFGRNHPGAITLKNYPSFLRNITLPEGIRMDLGAVDIYRDRERGVPRYNDFRELIHRGRVSSFEELTGADRDPARQPLADEIREVYKNIDNVDLMVGMFAEPLPDGFAFSDTAFRVFILMASRRLKSDRFLSADFKPEVYTHAGIEWIQKNTMRDVLIRHFPRLRAALRDVKNAFAPWNDVTSANEPPVTAERQTAAV